MAASDAAAAAAAADAAQPASDLHPSADEMLATRMSVTSVNIQGATRTHAALLDRILHPVFSTGGTFAGVIEDVRMAVERLRATNCFHGVDAYVDRLASPSEAAVLFTLAEKRWYQIRTSTSAETSAERSPLIEAAFLFRNLRGAADTLSASVEWGGSGAALSANPSTAWHIDYSRPFVLGLDNDAFATLRHQHRDQTDASSYALRKRTAEAGLNTPLGSFSALTAWRLVSNVPDNASPLILDDAHHTWISALNHVASLDWRDLPGMPTSGGAASLTTQLALPIGGPPFLRLDGSWQAHLPLAGAALSLVAHAGAVFARQRPALPDRFFLGGANSFRGFHERGVGPRDKGDALGGDLYYTLTALFSLPFPENSMLSQMFNARMHVFGTVGDLTEIATAREGTKSLQGGARQKLDASLQGIAKSARASVGLGVALDSSFGRMEFNFCQAMRFRQGDKIRPGFQFGIYESFS